MSLLDAMARAIYDEVRKDGMKDADWDEWNKRFFGKQMRAALAEARRHGWVLVPVEPTDEQRVAALTATSCAVGDADLDEIYRAMLSAAPSIEEG